MEVSTGEYTTSEIHVYNISQNKNGMKVIDRLMLKIQIPATVYTQPDDEPIFFNGCEPHIEDDKSFHEKVIENLKKLVGPKKPTEYDGRGTTGIQG